MPVSEGVALETQYAGVHSWFSSLQHHMQEVQVGILEVFVTYLIIINRVISIWVGWRRGSECNNGHTCVLYMLCMIRDVQWQISIKISA